MTKNKTTPLTIGEMQEYFKKNNITYNDIAKAGLTYGDLGSATEEQLDATFVLSRPVEAKQGEQPKKYASMLQGNATMELERVVGEIATDDIDKITGVATISKGDVTIQLDNIGKLDIGTQKLFNFLTIELTKNTDHSDGTVTVPLIEYAEFCGVDASKKSSLDKHRSKAKKQLDNLYRISLSWKEHGKKDGDFLDVRLLQAKGIIKNGLITVMYSDVMNKYLHSSYMMQYPTALGKLDERNPIPYTLGIKLSHYYTMDNNVKRGTNNIIKVTTLLEYLENLIPSYDVVMSGNRNITDRIIKPLVKALDVLQDAGVIKWNFCHEKKQPLTDEECAIVESDYQTFINSLIEFELIDAPDQTERIQANTDKAIEQKKLNDKALATERAKEKVKAEKKKAKQDKK